MSFDDKRCLNLYRECRGNSSRVCNSYCNVRNFLLALFKYNLHYCFNSELLLILVVHLLTISTDGSASVNDFLSSVDVPVIFDLY